MLGLRPSGLVGAGARTLRDARSVMPARLRTAPITEPGMTRISLPAAILGACLAFLAGWAWGWYDWRGAHG